MKKWFSGLLLLGLLAQGRSGLASSGSEPVLTAFDGGLRVSWQAPPVRLLSQPGGKLLPDMPGYELLNAPGLPRLPFSAVLVALPPGAQPRLEIEALEETRLENPAELALGLRPQGVVAAPDGSIVGGAFAESATAEAFSPGVVELEPVGIMRGVTLARLVFYPLRPDGDGLLAASRVQVTLHYNALEARPSQATGPMLSTIREAVANPEQAVPAWEIAGPARPLAAPSGNGPALAVQVATTGLTSLAYQTLAAAGFLPAGDPANLHLRRAGEEIAMQWEGDTDAIFEPGERLLFFAGPRPSRWAAYDVYFLSGEATPGLRMGSRSAAPGGLPAGAAWVEKRFEQNMIYMPTACLCGALPTLPDGDRWAWDELRQPDLAQRVYPVDLPALDGTHPATLTLTLAGYTDPSQSPDHQVDAAWNATAAGSLVWNGRQAQTGVFALAAGDLQPESTLTLTQPGLPGVTVEGAWLDGFSVRYARNTEPVGNAVDFTGEASPHVYAVGLATLSGVRAYAVAAAGQPVFLSGLEIVGSTVRLGDAASAPGPASRYLVVSEAGISVPQAVHLVEEVQGGGPVDLVVISPAAFVPALAELVALREGQGLAVRVETSEAIFDGFGEGRPAPEAIRAYLAEVYAAWHPEFVLLVGDGTYDPKNYLPSSSVSYLPPFLAQVDPWAGETAADNRFVTVDGADKLPDMVVGRLPVNSLAEAQAVVGKIVGYETRPAPGAWNGKVVVVADDADSAGDFSAMLETVAVGYVPAPFTPERIYHTPPTTTGGQVRAAVLDAWQAGAGAVLFAGHASVHQWAAEAFLHLNDVGGLANGPRLPVALEMTCFTASFHWPQYATLDEALVRQPGGGAVAAWGSTGLGISTGHDELAKGFMREVYLRGNPVAGQAALAGKLQLLARKPYYSDLVDTFTWLGDPAMHLALEIISASPGLIFLPSVFR